MCSVVWVARGEALDFAVVVIGSNDVYTESAALTGSEIGGGSCSVHCQWAQYAPCSCNRKAKADAIVHNLMRLRRLLAARDVEVILCTLYVNLEDRSRQGPESLNSYSER